MVINKFHKFDVDGFTYYIPRDIPENTDLITEIIKTLTPDSLSFISAVANHPLCYAVTFLRKPKRKTWYIQRVSPPEYSYRINEQTFVITNKHKILYILYCFILSKGLENDIQIHL